jgi:hypothetical protein
MAGPLDGVVIGLLSSFGSAVIVALIFFVIYFFRHTPSGRIFLDRIGRPGEYDDEQAFAREEAEALETMDDMQRTEYLRAKGISLIIRGINRIIVSTCRLTGFKLSYRGTHPSRSRRTFHYHNI